MVQRPKIFISHSGLDSDFAKRVRSSLREGEVDSFLDVEDLRPGDNFLLWMNDAIEAADHMLVLLGPESTDRQWFKEEWSAGRAREDVLKRRFVVPLILPGFRDADIPPLLKGLIYVNFRGREYAEAFNEVISLVRPVWQQNEQWLFDVGGYGAYFVPLLNRPRNSGEDGRIMTLPRSKVIVTCDQTPYQLPAAFSATPLEFEDDPTRSACCRLASYHVSDAGHLAATFSETRYVDYLRSGEHLDDPVPHAPGAREPIKTYRELFGRMIQEHPDSGNLRPFNLTNICGVGVLIETSDRKIVVSRQPAKNHVYPGRWKFSASGTLLWGAHPHPFEWAVTKSYRELHHQIDLTQMRLLSFGVDARKLYFQFCLYAKTNASFDQIRRRCPDPGKLDDIELRTPYVVDELLDRCWEPAAEVALLTLCAHEDGGWSSVQKVLNERRGRWSHRMMRDEWDYRASRSGDLAVMSVRYNRPELNDRSAEFVRRVMAFIGDEIRGKRVLEVGSGTGRITTAMLSSAQSITCVDLSERMIVRAQDRLRDVGARVKFVTDFAQDFVCDDVPEVVVCCMVLVHNVSNDDFEKLVSRLSRDGATLFIFEDVGGTDAEGGRALSPHTVLRDEASIRRAFEGRGYRVSAQDQFDLFGDRIAFLKLDSAGDHRSGVACELR